MPTIEEIIRKHALQNAVEHGGKASAGSVMGKVLGANPDLKGNAKEVHELSGRIVDEVNLLPPEEQLAELKRLGGPEVPKEAKKEEKGVLPPLPDAIEGKVIVRFAPNPDGAIHLGNARPAVLSYEYAKRYRGRFILRYDDTDPKVKRPERRFYKWVQEDLKWLGAKWDAVFFASKRLPIYHEYARQLIEKGGAYVCTCKPEVWKATITKGFPCSCREMHRDTQMRRWLDMLNHKYKEGEAVVRVKTDITHPNPAVRDWPALRIVDKPSHPLNKKDKVWPLFNFASGIDDHLLGTTHIFRGQEHSTNEEKQRWMYKYFGWEYPKVMLVGRFLFPEMVLSKSLIRKGIDEKEFDGWEDPRLGTIRALKRRGFLPEVLRQLIIDIGPRSSDATIAFENLAAYNRKVVDKTANRYFFVAEPVKIKIKDPPYRKAVVHKHPTNKAAGDRELKIKETIMIEKQDMDNLRGKEVRFIGLFNVNLQSTSVVTSTEVKQIPKIHWLPPEQSVRAKVAMPGSEISGWAEKNILKEKVGAVVQFERFGFCRIEKKTAKSIQAVFSHK
jgi:glutamyl-tRNA synthetase